MTNKLALTAVLAGFPMATFPAAAHHAFAAEFDSNKPVKLQGTVAKVELVNPHSWIYVDVKNEDGTVTQWMVEGGSPNALLRHGFTKKTLPKGTEVIFEGFQAKDGSHRANGRDLLLPGGQKVNVSGSGGGAAPDGSGKAPAKKETK